MLMTNAFSPGLATSIKLQAASVDIWDKKYRLKDKHGHPQENTISETFHRVALALADIENKDKKKWY